MASASVGTLSGLAPSRSAVAAAPRTAHGPVTIPISAAVACDQGGTIAFGGSVAGTVDVTGNGTLAINGTETMDACRTTIEGSQLVVYGTLQLAGNFVLVNNVPLRDQSTTLDGNLDITVTPSGSGRCGISLTVSYNIDTFASTVFGTACGAQVAY
jgi:hypothetical protein